MVQTVPITSDTLRGLDVFSALPAPALEQLLRLGKLRQLSRNQSLSSEPSAGAEHYYFLLRGAVAIALESDEPKTPRDTTEGKWLLDCNQLLGYFDAGACFSDAFLDPRTSRSTKIACVAANEVSLLQLERAHLGEVLAREPHWRNQLAAAVASEREFFLTSQDPTGRVVQDFFVRENYVTSKLARVGRLDRCLDCNKCRDACAERHGNARMARTGARLGRLTFPIACRNCLDQPCIAACSFGGIAFDEASEDIHISDRCVGCGACAQQCPNGAIFMVWRPYTVSDFPDPIPLSDAAGATNVSNLWVAGDISGAALIRLAMNEAVRAVDRIHPSQLPQDSGVLDMAIVGGGPAGLAAAIRCQERNLSYCVFERDQLASTIRGYSKNKHVMAEPSNVALLSSLWFEECSKEELLARWEQTARDRSIRIFEQTEIQRIVRGDRLFVLHSDRGQFATSHVLVCVGKGGAPRRLGVPGDSHPRVRALLDDPNEFAGQKILVVGGGDSALEAALALADVVGSEVTLSYRQAAFVRAKVQNRKRLEAYQLAGRIRVVLKSTVAAIEPGAIRLATERGAIDVPNDVVFALLGADPPTAFLQDAGIQVLQPGSPEMAKFAAGRGKRQRAVKCDHCAGYPDRACLSACPTGALIEIPADQLFLEAGAEPLARTRRFSDIPFLQGVSVRRARMKNWITACTLVILAAIGLECFLIRTRPEISLLGFYVQASHSHFAVSFTSGKGIGHWLGYVGASLMLASALYSLRTRVRLFKGWGSQTGWLSTHIWLGFTGATLVTYHSALKLDRWASVACILMWIVVATGAIGRFLFGKARSAVGLAEFELDALRHRCRDYAEQLPATSALCTLVANDLSGHRRHRTLAPVLWQWLRDQAALLWLHAFGIRHLQSKQQRRAMLTCFAEWAAQRRRRSYYQNLDLLMRHWNIIHVIFAIAMAILAGTHIVYGFRYKAV